MAKEKVKLIDGNEVEVEITSLGYRKAMQLASEYIPIDSIVTHPDKSTEIKGSIRLFDLNLAALETVKGLDLDKLDPQEGQRIYNKYFEKTISMALGQGGNPK